MCPRYHLTIHKKHRFLRMRTWPPAVMPSAHTTEAGKTARRWIEEQVRSRCRAERPARLWSSPVLCPQSLVISCTISAVSGHLLYYVRSLWSSPVLCLQSI
ncbi:unnamed protein product, partial [Staurois parvus]